MRVGSVDANGKEGQKDSSGGDSVDFDEVNATDSCVLQADRAALFGYMPSP